MTSNQLIPIEQKLDSFNFNLFQPIKNYVRIRYTNFAINSRYLICGASSGGLYLFNRTDDGDLKFLFTIPGNNGKISSIVFSKNNLDLFAFGTKRGVFKLILLKLTSDNLDKQQWQEIYSAKAFTKHSISLIEFQDDDLNEFKLFLADDAFNIFMISKMKTFSSIFKNEPPVRILNFDFPIYQLEADNQYLLVSAEDKSSIFNMEKITLNKIGTKARPNGVFGSCFYGRNQNENEAELKFVFTARPSLRLWQANQEGSVICTHQFKDYLNKNSCNYIYQFKDEDQPDQLDQESTKLSLNGFKTKTQFTNSNFNQIYKLQIKEFIYLVTFTNVPTTMLFIINPLNAQIVFWTDQITNPITKIMISEDELIICHRNESTMDENRKEIEKERLFTLIKIYDLDDFLHEDYLLKLSSLSLFYFLKENESISANLVKEKLDLKAYLQDEWSKLDDNQKSMFDNLKKLIYPDKTNGIENGVHFNEINSDSLNQDNENTVNGLNNDKEAINGVLASKSSSEGKINEISSILSKLAKSSESVELKPSNLLNGKLKKSIEELTSKHRWKGEVNDEKRTLKKKLKKLKQNLDKQQLDKLKCECNYPSPRSHLILNDKQKSMRAILIKQLDDNNIDEIMATCFEYAIWNLYLDLLILKNQFTDYIKISLLLMDINLLARNNVFIKKFKTDLELGKELFKLFVEQKNLDVNRDEQTANRTICLNCKMNLNVDYIRWQDIIDFLYKNLKLDDFLDLLMIHHHQLPYSVLNTKLCIHLLQTEMIKQYESSLTNDKLTKLNKHLTTRSLKQKSKSGLDQDNWSMYLDLSRKDCDICRRPLKGCREPLLVFKCNHIYHKACEESSNLVTKGTCYVCMNSNSK